MVLWVMKYDIHPDRPDEYLAWAQRSIPTVAGADGVVEFGAYRAVSGSHRVVTTVQFSDLATWQTWYESEAAQTVLANAASVMVNVETELWGPSPVLPQPIRPGG